MITPAYSATATERILPRLALDFTTAVADPRVATARAANTATRFNSSGIIEIVNAGLPRFDFSPTALVCRGQLIEEARTNLFLNSLIDGTNLATQSVTLSAVAHTLSFYGSGTVTISGGHSATVAGVGDFPNRRTYTFTPTAGSSTFTVSGDVKFAQLEAGAFATSFIPTAAASVLRNADVVSMTGTNFSDWYNASEGTFMVQGTASVATSSGAISVDDGTTSERIQIRALSGVAFSLVIDGGGTQASLVTGTWPTGTSGKAVLAYKVDSFACAAGGDVPATDTTGTVPTVNKLQIGGATAGGQPYFNGPIQKVSYWPQRCTDNEARAFSK